MDITDVEQMDWRQDSAFMTASDKLQRITTRGQDIERRVRELKQGLADDERELVQARAGILLGEVPEGADEVIQQRIITSREELSSLESEAAPIVEAITKLQQSLKELESRAKARMARPIETVIRATVQALNACLSHAEELNTELYRLHRHCEKQNVKAAVVGSPSFRQLNVNHAWGFLTQPNGEPSLELRTWRKHVEPALAED